MSKRMDRILTWLFIAAVIYLLPVTIIRWAYQQHEMLDDWKGGDPVRHECVTQEEWTSTLDTLE